MDLKKRKDKEHMPKEKEERIFITVEDNETLEHNLQREPEDWEIPAFATKPVKQARPKEKSLDKTDKTLLVLGIISMAGGLLLRI